MKSDRVSTPSACQLQHRLNRRYDLIQSELPIKNRAIPFYRVADPDKVLDDVAAADDLRRKLAGKSAPSQEVQIPYWAALWDSAFAVAAELADLTAREPSRSLNVLDLGCGLGAAGAAAIALGHRVLMADLHADALLFARLNGLIALEHRAAPPPTRAENFLRTRRLDWHDADLNEQFDLILGADLLYDRAQWPALEQFWLRHLRQGAQVLLGEPNRQSGDQFLEWIKPRPWTIAQSKRETKTATALIRILRLTPSPTEGGRGPG